MAALRRSNRIGFLMPEFELTQRVMRELPERDRRGSVRELPSATLDDLVKIFESKSKGHLDYCDGIARSIPLPNDYANVPEESRENLIWLKPIDRFNGMQKMQVKVALMDASEALEVSAFLRLLQNDIPGAFVAYHDASRLAYRPQLLFEDLKVEEFTKDSIGKALAKKALTLFEDVYREADPKAIPEMLRAAIGLAILVGDSDTEKRLELRAAYYRI